MSKKKCAYCQDDIHEACVFYIGDVYGCDCECLESLS